MPSFKDCIDDAANAGQIDPERAEEIRDLFDEIDADGRGRLGLGTEQAQARAAQQVTEAVRRDAIEKKRVLALQAKRTRALRDAVLGTGNVRDNVDPAWNVFAHVAEDVASPIESVEMRARGITGRAHRRMAELMETFHPTLTGGQANRAQMQNVVREIFGIDSGDATAKAMAQAWVDTADWLRRRFNAAGGHIPKRQDWGMPQSHDMVSVRRAGRENWKAFIRERIDINRIIDETTGLPITPQRLELALDDAFEAITTGGWSRRVPSGAARGRSLRNRHADHRFFVFKDADSWLEYQRRFGNGDPWSVMTDHIERMARDIARMEIFGPNDRAGLEFAIQTAKKELAGRDETVEGNRWLSWAETTYDHFAGRDNQAVGASWLAQGLQATRSALTSAMLGRAFLSSISDFGTAQMTAAFNGLSATRMMGRYLGLMNPANPAHRRLARRAGLVAENATNTAMAVQRHNLEALNSRIARRLPITVFNLSLLSPHTQAMRRAFGLETLGMLGDMRARGYENLPRALKDALMRYGIGRDRWEHIRAAGTLDEGLLDIESIASEDTITRLMHMIQSETELAVPSGLMQARAAITQGTKPGTIAGEFLRSALMFRSYPITYSMLHMRRSFEQGVKNTGLNRFKYAGFLFAMTTMYGALALQMKALGVGQDPLDMTRADFWSAAALQGGGLGIFGDFLFADQSRYGQDFLTTASGPMIGFLSDLTRLTVGNLQQTAAGEDDIGIGRDLVAFVDRYLPGGNIWYLDLAFDRMVMSQLSAMADPQAAQRRFRALERYARERGTSYWWGPGQTSPSRGIDIGNVVGQ